MTELSAVREWFRHVSRGALALIEQVPPDAAERPGLGNWNLAELTAHTIRAWTTLTQYLESPEPAGQAPMSAAEYLATGMTTPGIHEGVGQRAREDAAELGGSSAAAAREAAAAALEALEEAPDNRLVMSRLGPLTLREFVRTRTLELVVHGLDLARALGVEPPKEVRDAAVPAITLLAQAAAERGMATELLEAAAGRRQLPGDYNLMR